ncbi:iron complex transport system ATP-binding protein [Paracoccus isoporae]|uniref:Iron complex transport system ATP-binding protein n=1 Tax=Paracoccus isoporae TaxID=591205 RepID=A0A1G6TWT9_9RHOB|nr:ATP-binding cassette domain-containing protein [Paracoccus isoporae]SDD33384.1 iron complex transport system ATP-binding protein [Paracoccus isoporae]
MIELDGVCHDIGSTRILSDISAEIPRGHLTALIGPNGAGKSTLLRLIGRLESVQRGRIEIDGLDVAQTPSATLARRMAVLGQQTAISSRLRLSELVGFGRWPHHHGRPRDIDRAAVETALQVFGLSPLADRFLDEVSGGQAQRAYLAMTFAQDTDWLLLDEPLNNLDMSHARGLMARLSDLVRRAGKSVLVVVHEVNYAAAWADHIVAMKQGRIVAEGAPRDVLKDGTLSMLYDTPVAVTQHEGRPLVLHHY